MSVFAPLAAAPRFARAPAAVEPPVPPLPIPKLPETSVPSATDAGVQSVPLKRKCCPATGAVAKTLTERMRATVEALDGPVTSPLIVTEVLVELTTMFESPAPLPKNVPTNLLFRSEEHTSELQSRVDISYAVF